jgi:Protein of unknown function (DUF2628)
MKVYSVHYRHEDAASLAGLAERAVLVKDGFSWPALFFGPVWLAWRRMWLVLAFYVALMLVVAAIARFVGLPDGAVAIITTAINLLLALEGNGLCRWTLERRRYHERSVATGASLAEAEERFFATCTVARKAVAAGPLAP